MKSMMKDTAILFAITLIAGLILGAVYQITKDPIARQEELAMQEASRQVFSAATSFEAAAGFDGERAQDILKEGGYSGQTIDGCQIALDGSGAVLGYVITVTTHEGYGGDIQFLMGVSSDGSLNGISLLSISETPGLGMQAEEVLVPQFQNASGYPFESTKTGAEQDNQIDAISGATITTDAVIGGVNAGLYYFQSELDGRTETAGGEQDA